MTVDVAVFARSNLRNVGFMDLRSGKVVADCPKCGAEKALTLLSSGTWECARCSSFGAVNDLAALCGVSVTQSKVGAVSINDAMLRARKNAMTGVGVTEERVFDAPNLSLGRAEKACRELLAPTNASQEHALEYARSRGLTDATIARFLIGQCAMDVNGDVRTALLIPYVDGWHVPAGLVRAASNTTSEWRFKRVGAAEPLLYNVDGLRGAKRVVLTKGELDAVSLWQAGVDHVGAAVTNAKRGVPRGWLDVLAAAEDVVLWFGDDASGVELVRMLVEALGGWRCRVVRTPDAFDANDMVAGCVPKDVIHAQLDGAKHPENRSVVSMDAYAGPLLELIDQGPRSLGAPYGIEALDSTLRGRRTKEVNIITGRTKDGKSTFALDLELRTAAQGEPVLVSSMEYGPVALATKVFQQRFKNAVSSVRTDEDKERARAVVERLNSDPVYVLDVDGEIRMSLLFEYMRYARRRLGCRFQMLDHWDYIIPDAPSKDPLEDAKQKMLRLQSVAKADDIGINILMHPSGKWDDTTIPTHEDLRGGSVLKQLANSSTSVWRNKVNAGDSTQRALRLKFGERGQRFDVTMAGTEVLVAVTMVRHDAATTGMSVLQFSGRTLSYTPRPAEDTAKDDKPTTVSTADPFPELPFSEGDPANAKDEDSYNR